MKSFKLALLAFFTPLCYRFIAGVAGVVFFFMFIGAYALAQYYLK